MRIVAGMLLAIALGCAGVAETSPKAKKLNILLIMADDLGFSDLGCYGGEIDTPNLDGLAKNGLRFTRFYNTARCWPTRAALLTGYYAQQVRRDTIPGPKVVKRGGRPTWAPLLPRLLKPLGYRSYHSGKWHIDGMPIANGFDRSYYLKDQGRFFSPKIHWKDDKALPVVERGTGYYGTTAIADHAIEVLGKKGRDGEVRELEPQVLAGPLCESGDVFTRDAEELLDPRLLPRAEVGDLILVRDAGAYGFVMSSNYNSLGRPPQVWVEDGTSVLVSRRETVEDLTRSECLEEL